MPTEETKTVLERTFELDGNLYREAVPVLRSSHLQEEIRPVSADDVQGVISALKAYREKALSKGAFDMKEFKEELEPVFAKCGYRTQNPGGGGILIITDSSGGDFILLTPCLREIRRIYKDAPITLVCSVRVADLAGVCPYVDDVYFHGNGLPVGDFNFLVAYDRSVECAAYLLRQRFSLAFVFGIYSDSYLLSFLSGAKERISYGSDSIICSRAFPMYKTTVCFLTYTVPARSKGFSLVDRFLGVLEGFFHTEIQSRNIEIWLLPYETTKVREVVFRKFGSRDVDTEYIAIGVGGTTGRKCWPMERYVELMKSILEINPKTRFLIIGGDDDTEKGQAVERGVGEQFVLDLTGKLNFRQSAAVIAMCAMYIGNDTSTMHLAATKSVPVLSPNCRAVSQGINEHSVIVQFKPYNVPAVVVLPAEALPGCQNIDDDYGCLNPDTPHCITQVTVKLMLDGFHLLKKMQAQGICETKFIY